MDDLNEKVLKETMLKMQQKLTPRALVTTLPIIKLDFYFLIDKRACL